MALGDRRDDMDLDELLEELELRFPEEVARVEGRWGDVEDLDDDERADLIAHLRSRLRV